MIKQTKILFYNQKGQGAGYYNNKIVYLDFVILSEVVAFEITAEFKNYYQAKVAEIVQASQRRNYNLPSNYELIGGYELLHMDLIAEQEYKEYVVKNDFKNIAKIDLDKEINIEYFQGNKEFRYRNKITLFDGALYQKKTHNKIYLDDFLLTDIKPKTNLKGKIILRKLNKLIIGSKKDIELFNFDDLLGLRFRININSFYQVNKEVAQHAYQRIIDFVQEGDFVLDLYSGIGTISLLVAQKAKKVIAVEENKFAHKDVLFNQKINKINNVSFKNKEVFEFLKDFDDLVDTIIVDPAREGVQKAAIKEILRLNPKRIIYLSCNPATQAYDFSLLKHKYKIIFFEIHNMFVKTFHIENLICLERK